MIQDQMFEFETYTLKQIDSKEYQLRKPIKLVSLKQGDHVCVTIKDLEIFTYGETLNDAVSEALEEMLLLFDVIVDAPIYSVANDEILSFRRFLKRHIHKVQ